MSDPINDSLRFVVPLDLGREDDRALSEVFAGVPNGLIGSVARLLLARSLPNSTAALDALLIEAMREQASRNRLRGRPVGQRSSRRSKPSAEPQLDPVVPTVERSESEQALMAPPSIARAVPAVAAPLTEAPREASSLPAAPVVADIESAPKAVVQERVAAAGGRRPDVLARARGLVALS